MTSGVVLRLASAAGGEPGVRWNQMVSFAQGHLGRVVKSWEELAEVEIQVWSVQHVRECWCICSLHIV